MCHRECSGGRGGGAVEIKAILITDGQDPLNRHSDVSGHQRGSHVES